LWVQLATVPPRWVGFDLAQFERGLSWFVGYWLALLGGGSLLAAFALVRYFTRPLRELAQAAVALGQRQPLPPLQPGGNAELRALQQALQTSAEALTRVESERNLLLAGISHDLRTPLTRMQLGLEMLTDPDAELLRGLHVDIAEMTQIINQFIDFVRGSYEESLQATDLNALIIQVSQRYTAFGTLPQLKLAPLPSLPLRPQALRRLLTNLLDNAYRHGQGQVWLMTAYQDARVLLTVRDAGPGLPESFLETALKPYTRLDVARGSPGTGLGLAIVERIAQAHQGEVCLSNHPEGGLVVMVRLPCAPRPSER
jgi:two-component system osmolarity sensor histidine kinase EnvZ